MMELEAYLPLSMIVVGLLGAGHCVGMCGPIAVALSAGESRVGVLLGYNLGRIISYVIAGLLAGMVSGFGAQYLSLALPLRIVAALLLILMGLYISDWWRILARLEIYGQKLWRKLQPLSARLGPADNGYKALLLGMLWGWLPCGLVYSALGTALASGSLYAGAQIMFMFGLGTLPAMLIGGGLSSKLATLLQRRKLRQLSGLLLIAMGCWMLYLISQHGQHQNMINEETTVGYEDHSGHKSRH